MKKLIIISSGFVIVCIIVAFGILPNIRNISSADDNSSNDKASSHSITYIVKNFNGRVAVFEDSNSTPFRVTDVNIKDLPKDDQILLESGITANSKEQLNSILEDYLS